MTSTERREARYQRRQAARAARREERAQALGRLEDIYSFRRMILAGRKCCNGVRHKQSTQNFEWHLFSGTAARRRLVLEGKWKPGKGNHFTLCERGKVRPIDAPHIRDRQVEKVATDDILIPLYAPEMIYRNGASQKGKGLHWHYKQLKELMRRWYRMHGLEGVMVQTDFHGFFPGIPHWAVFQHQQKMIPRADLRLVPERIVQAVAGAVGMPLGVQPSQQEMVSLPSPLDNWLLCQRRVYGVGHYMDDYHGFQDTVEAGRQLVREIIQKAATYGFEINERKCHVTPLDKAFRFCKVKFQMLPSGRIITHGCRDGVKHARRKMRLLQERVEQGLMTPQEVWASIQSHVAYYENFNDHGRVLRIKRIFYAIFMKKKGLTWTDILHPSASGRTASAAA